MHSALTELPLTPEAEGTPPNVSSDDVPDLGASHSQSVFKECDLCRRSSPKVYAERWVCLNSSCANFWLLEEGDTPPDSLSYSTSFLALVPFAPQELVDIRPSPPPNILSQRIDVTTSRHFCKGWHCRSCGRLSSR